MMNSSEIYKRLAGGPKSLAQYMTKRILIVFGIYAAVTLFFTLFAVINGIDWGAMVGFLAALTIILFPIYLLFVIKDLGNDDRKIAKRLELLRTISEVEFYELDKQMSESEFYYKTFYFLDEYLYAPKARLLIKYADITSYRTKIHYDDFHLFLFLLHRQAGVIERSARLYIYDNEGVFYKINVKKWRDYLRNENAFNRMLNEKRAAYANNAFNKENKQNNFKGWC